MGCSGAEKAIVRMSLACLDHLLLWRFVGTFGNHGYLVDRFDPLCTAVGVECLDLAS